MRHKGFTMVELLIVATIIGIIITVGIINFPKLYKLYKFNEYKYMVENFVKMAKVKAMELTENMAICVDTSSRALKIVNLGSQRSINCRVNTPCTDASRPCVLSRLDIEEDFIHLDGWSTGFDPRGFALRPGRVCIDREGQKYYKICISRFGAIRIDEGNGACGRC